MRPVLFCPGLRVLALAGSLLLLAGCATEREHRHEHVAPPVEEKTPEMEGHAAFLQQTLVVDVVLNRAGFGSREAEAGGGGERRGGSGRFRGGFGGGRGHRGGGGDERGGGSDSDAPTVHLTPSNQPPVRLHLRFTNQGEAALEVEVPQFDSDLGNFVVQPAKLSIPPHGTVEADPMTSRLGVPADQVPITMTVRANGTTEHQVIFLRLVAPPAPAATP